MEETQSKHPDTAEEEEAAMRRKQPRNVGVFDGTGGGTVLLRVVREEGKVGAVELEEVGEEDETVGCDESSHSHQEEKQKRVHFVKCLELSPRLLKSK